MACQLRISYIVKVIPPGSLRGEIWVYGSMPGCISAKAAIQSPFTSPFTPSFTSVDDKFMVKIPIPQPGVQCNDDVTIIVVCDQDPNCKAQISGPLECCKFGNVAFQAKVPAGSLVPAELSVMGVALGSLNNTVNISSWNARGPLTNPSPASVNPITGDFSAIIPITGSVQCDEKITVRVERDPNCYLDTSDKLYCPECFRATVRIRTPRNPCTGIPSTELINLDAVIEVPAGAVRYVRWDYGDGPSLGSGIRAPNYGQVFTINNTTGTATTQYNITDTHSYASGSYTAKLIEVNSLGSPTECLVVVMLPIVVHCCPAVASKVLPGKCNPDGTRQPTDLIVEFTPDLPAGSTYTVQWTSGAGPPTPVTGSVPAGSTLHELKLTVPYTAGSTYYPSANITITMPSGNVCTFFVKFTYGPTGTLDGYVIIEGCPQNPCCPILNLNNPQVTGCAPNNALVTFNASLNWPSGCSPPTATIEYVWTIDGPGDIFQKTTSVATTDTSAGWKNLTTNTVGPVDLTRSGGYSVSVVAKWIGKPDSCNPIGTLPFSVPVCNCPKRVSNNEWYVSNTTAPLGPNSFQTLDCDAATVDITFNVDPGSYSQNDLLYTWDFDDGSPQISIRGPAGAKQTHTFTNQTPGQAHTYDVVVTVTVPGSTNCFTPITEIVHVTVPGCNSYSDCPRITGLAANPSSGSAPLMVNFQANVTNPAAIVPDSNGNLYHWDFGDGQTADTKTPNTSHTYTSSGTFAATVTINVPSGCSATVASASVTVRRQCPPGQHLNAQGNCVSDTINWGCGILRLLLVLLFAALIITIVGGACLNWSWWIALGIAIAVVIALILWIVLCRPTFCQVLLTIWQTMFVATMLLLYLAPCIAKATAAYCSYINLAWILGAVLTIVFFLWWYFQCEASWCDILNALLFAVADSGALLGSVYVALRIISSLSPALAFFGSCLPMVNTIVAAGLGIAVTVLITLIGISRCEVRP